MAVMDVVVNSVASGSNGCFWHFDRGYNSVFVFDDPAVYWHQVRLGTTDFYQNSQCTVSGSGSSVSGAGNTATVAVNFTFAPAWTGAKFFWQQVGDRAGLSSGWGQIPNASFTILAILAREPVTSPPVYQPPPVSEPVPTPPAPVSASVTNCDDISGVWSSTSGNTFSLFQTGSTVTGTETSTDPYCGTVEWEIGGPSSGGGLFTLTESNPQPLVDACGQTVTSGSANVQITSCSNATVTPTGSGGSTAAAAQRRSALAAAQTMWTRTSSPPGVAVTVDLMAGRVNTQLTGQKTGNLTIAINGTDGQQPVSLPHASAQGGNSFSDSFRRMLTAGRYGSVVATWDTASVTVPVSFYLLGNTRFSQYNTPYEQNCHTNLQPAYIYYRMDAQYCYSRVASLGSQFISQVIFNGTGVLGTGEIVKSYDAGARNICPLPTGASPDNTFFSVDTGGNPITKITGAHNTVLSDATGTPNPFNNGNPQPGSLATDPNATTPKIALAGPSFQWGDLILLVDQSDNNDPLGLRSVQDYCPGCRNAGGAHIDMYSSRQTCGAGVDYGNRTAIRLR